MYEEKDLENLFHAFHRMHHDCMRRELERRGLQDVGNPAILFILRNHTGGKPVTQRQIADMLGVSPPTVAVSVKRMERAGLIHKQTHDSDMRKNCISLTDKGKAVTDESIAVGRDIYQTIFSNFTETEIEVLREYYIRMIGNLSALKCRRPAFVQFHKQNEDGIL